MGATIKLSSLTSVDIGMYEQREGAWAHRSAIVCPDLLYNWQYKENTYV